MSSYREQTSMACISDFEKYAEQVLTKQQLEFLLCGANDEHNVKENIRAFQRWEKLDKTVNLLYNQPNDNHAFRLKTYVNGWPIIFICQWRIYGSNNRDHHVIQGTNDPQNLDWTTSSLTCVWVCIICCQIAQVTVDGSHYLQYSWYKQINFKLTYFTDGEFDLGFCEMCR